MSEHSDDDGIVDGVEMNLDNAPYKSVNLFADNSATKILKFDDVIHEQTVEINIPDYLASQELVVDAKFVVKGKPIQLPDELNFSEKVTYPTGNYALGICAADFDNDGDLDLYFTTVYGGDHCVLYRNDGNWHFTDVTAESGIEAATTYQAAWADYDNDGDLDLLTGSRLYQNHTASGHWLKVRLQGQIGRAHV